MKFFQNSLTVTETATVIDHFYLRTSLARALEQLLINSDVSHRNPSRFLKDKRDSLFFGQDSRKRKLLLVKDSFKSFLETEKKATWNKSLKNRGEIEVKRIKLNHGTGKKHSQKTMVFVLGLWSQWTLLFMFHELILHNKQWVRYWGKWPKSWKFHFNCQIWDSCCSL